MRRKNPKAEHWSQADRYQEGGGLARHRGLLSPTPYPQLTEKAGPAMVTGPFELETDKPCGEPGSVQLFWL